MDNLCPEGRTEEESGPLPGSAPSPEAISDTLPIFSQSIAIAQFHQIPVLGRSKDVTSRKPLVAMVHARDFRDTNTVLSSTFRAEAWPRGSAAMIGPAGVGFSPALIRARKYDSWALAQSASPNMV